MVRPKSQSHCRYVLLFVTASLFMLAVLASALAAQPLHQRIDQAIESSHVGPLAKPAGDAEFLRRIYLNLTGMIPSSQVARAFLDDAAPDKRPKLIDRLSASGEFNRHMATTFDVMMMERRGDKHVKTPEWQKYLFESLAANKPYDQLVREILGTDGVDPKLRPAAKFYLDRGGEVNLLTRDVARVFFGMDIQCAQCHDHPLVDDYLQADYYGIYAFLNRSYPFADKKTKKTVLAEKADGEVTFVSVFSPDDKSATGPKLPGDKAVEEPWFKKGEAYSIKPAKEVRPVPKYSRRAELAKGATAGNRAFNRNIANRLWAIMMGRGIVDPVDLHHGDNPPSHPELLDELASEFVAMKYDVRAFMRELALSRTYQRSFEMPADLAISSGQASEQLDLLASDQKRLAIMAEQSTAASGRADVEVDSAAKAIEPVKSEWTKADVAVLEKKKAADQAAATLAATQKKLAAKQTLLTALSEAAVKGKAAADQLPEEKQLAAAIAVFRARADQTSAEVAATTKTLSQHDAASKAASEQFAAAQQAVQPIAVRLAEARKPLGLKQQQAAAATIERLADRYAVAAVERRINEINALVEFGKLTAAERAAQKQAQTDPQAVGQAAAKAEAARIALADLGDGFSKRFAVAGLVPLSPEQLTWSTMQAAGLVDAQRLAIAAEWDKKHPADPAKTSDAQRQAARNRHVEQTVHDKLKGNQAAFIKLFAAAAGQVQTDFHATADQALFYANGTVVRSWLAPSGENLTARLIKLEDPQALAEELYLSVLTRRPSPEETADVASYLATDTKERSAKIQEITWALLSSAEFRFSH